MLKHELIIETASRLQGHFKQDIAQAVDIILEDIGKALLEDRHIELRNFGSLSVSRRMPRAFRNPRTGCAKTIPERKTVRFTMCKRLRENLLKPF